MTATTGSTGRFVATYITIILLAIATALIHFYHASHLPFVIGWSIWMNGAGYLVLMILLYLPAVRRRHWQNQLRWTLFIYTVLTIVLYVIFGLVTDSWAIPYGPIDKGIEFLLLWFLWLDGQQAKQVGWLERTQ